MLQYNVTVSMGGSAFPTRLSYAAHSTSATLAVAESGLAVGNDGASGVITLDLPASSLGLNYRVADTTGNLIIVRPPSGVSIIIGNVTATNASPLTSSTNGDWLSIVNISATVWVVYASSGNWSL